MYHNQFIEFVRADTAQQDVVRFSLIRAFASHCCWLEMDKMVFDTIDGDLGILWESQVPYLRGKKLPLMVLSDGAEFSCGAKEAVLANISLGLDSTSAG